MFKENKNYRAGFSLMDVIIASAIIVAVVLPVFGLLNSITKISRSSADSFIAAGLAQEGIEVVRAIRDSNWLTPGAAWDQNLSPDTTTGCVAYNSPDLNTCNPVIDFLKIDPVDGYNYSAGSLTKFTRRIEITHNMDGTGADMIQVLSVVNWDNGSKSLTAEDRLYNWQP